MPDFYLGTVLVDARVLLVVCPGVLEHQPHVVDKLPGVLVLAGVELLFDAAQVHRLLDDVKVVRDPERFGVDREAEEQRLRLLIVHLHQGRVERLLQLLHGEGDRGGLVVGHRRLRVHRFLLLDAHLGLDHAGWFDVSGVHWLVFDFFLDVALLLNIGLGFDRASTTRSRHHRLLVEQTVEAVVGHLVRVEGGHLVDDVWIGITGRLFLQLGEQETATASRSSTGIIAIRLVAA